MALTFTKYVIDVCTENSKENKAFNKSKESAVTSMTAAGLTKKQQDMLLSLDQEKIMAEIGREYAKAFSIEGGDHGDGPIVSVFHHISAYK